MPSFDPANPLPYLVAALSGAAVVLWRAYASAIKERITDLIAQRDLSQRGWIDQTAATNRLAEALEERNRRDRSHVRAEDPT